MSGERTTTFSCFRVCLSTETSWNIGGDSEESVSLNEHFVFHAILEFIFTQVDFSNISIFSNAHSKSKEKYLKNIDLVDWARQGDRRRN